MAKDTDTILALDTSSAACSVALSQGAIISECFEMASRSHTQRLLPMVDAILNQHKIGLHELGAIAFSRGPGSFTGLRIGMGVVQGLAFGAELPVVAVSTLDAMAAGVIRQQSIPENGLLCIAVDARMGECYWRVYRVHQQTPEPLNPESLSRPEDICGYLQGFDEPLFAAGSGWALEGLEHLPQQSFIESYCHAYDVAAIGRELWAKGQAQPVESVEPCYLRNQVTWQKRQKIRTQAK